MPQYLGSSTPVANGHDYTSQWVLKDIFKSVTGSVYTDKASTLYIEQSGDGEHADVSDSVAVSASTGTKFSQDLTNPWVRVRLTNASGSDQTVLRLFVNWVQGEMP